MKRRAALVLVVLVLLSGVPSTALAGTQEEKAGTINPLFKNPLKELSSAEDGEREALIALMEVLLNETLNGDIIVSETMRIRNIHWNGTSIIFQIWWYDNNQPIAMQTYKWENPERALEALRKTKTGETTEESLAKAFTVEPLSTSRGLRIIDVDYLTNDNNGEYVVLYNGGSSTFTASGWYLMDDYAYNNERCWVNETPSIPKNHCHDSFGRDHVRRFSISLGPGEIGRILIAGSSSSAILNNPGDTVYLIDNKGNLADIYSYTGAPKVTVRGISYSPSPLKEGDYLDVIITLDNSGPVNGKGHVELYLDGVLIKKSAVTLYAYHTWEYKMYNVWRATPGSHVLTARFVPDYEGSASSSSTTLKVSESRPYISEVSHTMLVEKHPIRFHVNVVNPSGNRKDVILKLFVDGVEIGRLNSYVYKRWGFDLWWKKPGRGFHDVEIKLYNANGTVVYSTWARNIYIRENSPPEVVSVDLPSFLYSNEWSNGTIVVNDAEGDRVNVSVEVVGRFSFRRTGLYPRSPHRFPLAPIYNHTDCRENVTIRFTPVDEYGKVGETVTKVVPVLTDSDKDGWCNALEREYGTNPYSNDTDGDGVIDSKDVDPLRDVKVTVYILRARALDDVDSSIAGHNPADMSLELTVNGQTKTLS